MSALFRLTWRDHDRHEHSCVVAAINPDTAVEFARRHYADSGPRRNVHIEQVTKAEAQRLRCDQLNANQLPLL